MSHFPTYRALLLTFGMAALPLAGYAQQWGGSTTTNGDIYRDGDVGIGTTNPQAELDVQGTLRLSSGGDDEYIRYRNHNLYIQNEGYAHQSIHFRPDLDAQDRFLNSTLHMYSSQDQTYTEKVRITAKWHSFFNGGNVGIGTTSPSYKLDVNGNMRVSGSIRSDRVWLPMSSESGYNRLRSVDGNESVRLEGQRNLEFVINEGGAFHGSAALNVWRDGPSDTPLFRVQNNGNVGIGTISPSYKLDVTGTVRANEVIVESSGADFVFDDTYALPTLEEVDAYINANGHLPDVPSAAEMQAEGVSLAAFTTTLLQKIEELTLYVIEQHERADAQQAQNDALQQQVADQEERNAILLQLIRELQTQNEQLEARLQALEQH